MYKFLERNHLCSFKCISRQLTLCCFLLFFVSAPIFAAEQKMDCCLLLGELSTESGLTSDYHIDNQTNCMDVDQKEHLKKYNDKHNFSSLKKSCFSPLGCQYTVGVAIIFSQSLPSVRLEQLWFPPLVGIYLDPFLLLLNRPPSV